MADTAFEDVDMANTYLGNIVSGTRDAQNVLLHRIENRNANGFNG